MLQEITRRRFFKQVAAACATAVVAPVVLAEKKQDPPFKPNTVQVLYMRSSGGWKNYATTYKGPDSIALMRKLRSAISNTKFEPPVLKGVHG